MTTWHQQPKVQTAAQRLEYLFGKQRTASKMTKSRYEVFTYWLKSEQSSVEAVSKSTSLRDISITTRRLLLSNPNEEPFDGRELLLKWSKPPKVLPSPSSPLIKRERSSTLKTRSNLKREDNKKLQLKESSKEIETWLFSIAIYVLWKRESKCNEALALCSRAIEITSNHVSNIATLSPRSPIQKEENEDKMSSLKIFISKLQKFETLIAQESAQPCLVKDEDSPPFSWINKQRMESLKRRMEFNKQRLESLHTTLDFKANMINFNLINIQGNGDTDEIEEGDPARYFPSTDIPCKNKATMSNVLYPHLVYHPYFNTA